MSAPPKSQSPADKLQPSFKASGKENSPVRSTSTTPASKTSTTIRPDLTRSRSSRLSASATPISARAAVKRAPNGSPSTTNVRTVDTSDSTTDADARAQSAAAIDDLQERLQTTERTAEEYQKQTLLLQSRLNGSLDDQARLEETISQLTARIDGLESEKRDHTRSRRDLEAVLESDRAAAESVKVEARAKEQQLQETIQRLKDNLAQKEPRGLTGASVEEIGTANDRGSRVTGKHFAPTTVSLNEAEDPHELIERKDKIIEALRLELTDVQIKMVELENLGGGHVHELERSLMESRMTNARLTEENDSFQLLLSERTLNGDLVNSGILQRSRSDSTPTSAIKITSLADELEIADNDDEGTKQFKLQIASLKDENKALSLYINNIISRLLAHEMEFVLDKNPNAAAKPIARSPEKDLPLPPATSESDDANGEGFIARTRTMIGSRLNRPQSMIISEPPMPPTPHENPDTAPSIPIGRNQARSTSGGQRRGAPDWNSAAVVNNMYRGPSPTRSSGQLSPGIASPRNSFFASRPSITSRVTSGTSIPTVDEADGSPHKPNRDSKMSNSGNSVSSGESKSASPTQSTFGGTDRNGSSVMMGSKMRPLRLVQNADDELAARKAANRGSWMGWFNQKVGQGQ